MKQVLFWQDNTRSNPTKANDEPMQKCNRSGLTFLGQQLYLCNFIVYKTSTHQPSEHTLGLYRFHLGFDGHSMKAKNIYI